MFELDQHVRPAGAEAAHDGVEGAALRPAPGQPAMLEQLEGAVLPAERLDLRQRSAGFAGAILLVWRRGAMPAQPRVRPFIELKLKNAREVGGKELRLACACGRGTRNRPSRRRERERFCPSDAEALGLVRPPIRIEEDYSGLAGQPAPEDQERAAREVIATGRAEVVVLSLGAEGALLVTEAASERFAAIAVEAKSTVGAGDSMLAGIVLALARGANLNEAVRFGVAAGAAALLGSGTELCRREDVERLYADRGR